LKERLSFGVKCREKERKVRFPPTENERGEAIWGEVLSIVIDFLKGIFHHNVSFSHQMGSSPFNLLRESISVAEGPRRPRVHK